MTAVATLDTRAKDDLAARMIPVAAALACAVREESAEEIGGLLDDFDRQELYGLTVVLAAMVDVESPVGDLLRWTGGPGGPRMLAGAALRAAANPAGCGTRAAYQRHLKNRTPPDQACKDAEADYQQERRNARKERASRAA